MNALLSATLSALAAVQSPGPLSASIPADESADLAAVADEVAAAFDTHPFVFLGSTHGSKKVHDFLLCLLARPAFQQRVRDVLVEWANPVHQSTMDRYLLALEPVPEDSLRSAWFDTDYPELWARLPQIPGFFAAVRAVNARLEPAQRIRVIGGCEPVDWTRVSSAGDMAPFPFKTNWSAHVITEHFAPEPDRRLLVVYGDGHIHHGGTLMSDIDAKLERSRLYVIGTIRDLQPAETDRVARLGDVTRPFLRVADLPASGPYPGDLFYAGDEPLQSHIDAVVYLGPEPDRNLVDSIELTSEQRAEMARRSALVGGFPDAMHIRLKGLESWFRDHPKELPPRP